MNGALSRRSLLAGGAAFLGGLWLDGPAARAASSGTAGAYLSRPDLSPPLVTVTARSKGASSVPILLAPITGSSQYGPLILDAAGEPLWFHPLPAGTLATAFAVQQYRGAPVLTWWEGKSIGAWGEGEYVIADASYRELARLSALDGLWGDLHEFRVTSRGTALVSVYRSTTLDLTSAGGPAQGLAMEGVVQEIDIATKRLLLEWRSSDHIPVSDSYVGYPTSTDPDLLDYFHLNSVGVDTDGNLIVSARHTCCIYKIDRKSGDVIWRLGGKSSDFAMGPGARFWYQHDARAHDGAVITLFDDGSSGAASAPETVSRALRLHLDTKAMTATLVKAYPHPAGALATKLGSAQILGDGGMFVSWGDVPAVSEFAADGTLRFGLESSATTYRAQRSVWKAKPTTRPAVAVRAASGGGVDVHASWNGATDVTSWSILGGASATSFRELARAPRSGFETVVHVAHPPALLAVAAIAGNGSRLGTSTTARV